MRGLVRAFSAAPLPADEVETLLAASMTVPARIRASLAAREIDCDDVLRALTVPLLVAHGRADTIVLPAMAEHVLATCPTATAAWYGDAAHVPHLEDPARFNRAGRARATDTGVTSCCADRSSPPWRRPRPARRRPPRRSSPSSGAA
jgi:pimeloyl-ACP methyl ester carboxylesterase